MDSCTIQAELKPEEKVTKIEVYVDGELIDIFTDTLNRVECDIYDRQLKGDLTLTFLVYDRYLNCSVIERDISVG